jgi:hypothetical protein
MNWLRNMGGGQPQQPGATPAPQGNAWGRQFQQQNGAPPGQLRDLWTAFRNQNGIGGGQPEGTPPATGAPPAGTPSAPPVADGTGPHWTPQQGMDYWRSLQSNPEFQNSGFGKFIGGMGQLGNLFRGAMPGQGGGTGGTPPAGTPWGGSSFPPGTPPPGGWQHEPHQPSQQWQDWRTALQAWRQTQPVQDWMSQRPAGPTTHGHGEWRNFRQSEPFQTWMASRPEGRPTPPAGRPFFGIARALMG